MLFLAGVIAACNDEELPTLSLSTTSLSFAQVLGTPEPDAQAISVTLDGVDKAGSSSRLMVVPKGAGGMPRWLTVDTNEGRAPGTIRVMVETSTLPPGTYEGAFAIIADGTSNGEQRINVSLTVDAAPVVALSANTLSFTSSLVDPPAAAQTVNITNSGGASIGGLATQILYEPGQSTGWLTATLSATTTPSVLTLVPVSGSVQPQSYKAKVLITSPDVPGDPKVVSVSYDLKSRPTILPSASGAFWNLSTGTQASARVIDIVNYGGGQLTGLTATTQYLGAHAPGWLTVTLDKTTAPARMTVQPNTASLPAGNYGAKIELKSPDAPLSYIVDVGLSIDTIPVLVVRDTALAFTWRTSQTGPARMQAVSVLNGGSGTLAGLKAEVTYRAGEPTGWLAAYPPTGENGGVLLIQAGGQGMPKGGYTGYVTVSVPGAANSPWLIYVSLYVID